jgi:hypothetical protein
MKPQDSTWIPGSPRAVKRGTPGGSNEPATKYINYYCIYYASRGDGTDEEATTRRRRNGDDRDKKRPNRRSNSKESKDTKTGDPGGSRRPEAPVYTGAPKRARTRTGPQLTPPPATRPFSWGKNRMAYYGEPSHLDTSESLLICPQRPMKPTFKSLAWTLHLSFFGITSGYSSSHPPTPDTGSVRRTSPT